MSKIIINEDIIKKLDINEGSILVLKMPKDSTAKDVTVAMDAVQKTGKDSIDYNVGVVVLPHDHELEKMDLQSLIMLKMRIDSLVLHYTKIIIDAKAVGES